MANISGTVVDQTNTGIPNTAVMLSGAFSPQVMLTDTQGKFDFSGLVDGAYKLTADQQGSIQSAQQFVQLSGGVSSAGILLKLSNLVAASYLDDARYVKLKYAQYGFLMIVGLIYFGIVAFGIRGLTVNTLLTLDGARGVITYFVAVTTISMAAMLMLAAVMTGGKDLDKRFALGKEIVTLLIGVLGTIIGFYFGSANQSKSDTTTPNQTAVVVDSIELNHRSGANSALVQNYQVEHHRTRTRFLCCLQE